MKIIKTKILDLKLIQPKFFKDNRGCFSEIFNKKDFENIIHKINFVQINSVKSHKGVLRGLHFQNPPYDQSKLVSCITGEVMDVVVDLRSNSPTYGQFESIILSEKNKLQLFIPKGFAHGYITLSAKAIFLYAVDNFYEQKHENGIFWNDKTLNIDWILDKSEIIVSKKDQKQLPFSKIFNPF
tara:strand:- start:58 stop:606 length:549 start_codon:yes stop_codon:yes gene_type:complete